jgi:hypothetical protein
VEIKKIVKAAITKIGTFEVVSLDEMQILPEYNKLLFCKERPVTIPISSLVISNRYYINDYFENGKFNMRLKCWSGSESLIVEIEKADFIAEIINVGGIYSAIIILSQDTKVTIKQ